MGQWPWNMGVSLIQANSIISHLSRYPDKSSALALDEGLIKGFKLMHSGSRLPVNAKHLTYAYQHTHFLQDKIDKDVEQSRVAGPFNPPMYNFHISPIDIVPKADGGSRMIMHLFYSPFISVNYDIDPRYSHNCHLHII